MDEIDIRVKSLQGSIADIKAIGDDKNVFQLVGNSNEENHVVKGEDGVISIQGSTDALHIHEIKHVARSLASKDGMQFDKDGLLRPVANLGIDDEPVYKAIHDAYEDFERSQRKARKGK
jgi:hypothetical protein